MEQLYNVFVVHDFDTFEEYHPVFLRMFLSLGLIDFQLCTLSKNTIEAILVPSEWVSPGATWHLLCHCELTLITLCVFIF